MEQSLHIHVMCIHLVEKCYSVQWRRQRERQRIPLRNVACVPLLGSSTQQHILPRFTSLVELPSRPFDDGRTGLFGPWHDSRPIHERPSTGNLHISQDQSFLETHHRSCYTLGQSAIADYEQRPSGKIYFYVLLMPLVTSDVRRIFWLDTVQWALWNTGTSLCSSSTPVCGPPCVIGTRRCIAMRDYHPGFDMKCFNGLMTAQPFTVW